MSDNLRSVESQVLEIISYNDIDYSEIGKRVALEYPAIFLMMTRNYATTKEIKNFIIEGKMISAIKARREMTGEGHKEAKEYCDSLRYELRKQWHNC